MFTLLHHPDGKCPDGPVVPICRYVSCNDGTVNDPGEWDAFKAAIVNGSKVGSICPADPAWAFPRKIGLDGCYGVTLTGYGQGASKLILHGDPSKEWGQNGIAFSLVDAALCTVRDFAVHCDGPFIYGFGVLPSANGTCDRTFIDRVEVSGNDFSDAAFGLYRSGEVTADSLSLFNYGEGNSAVVQVQDATGGLTLRRTQFHQYACADDAPIGPSTIYVANAGRVTIEGGILGSEPDTPRPHARSYLHLGANVDGVLLDNVLCQSDNGRPPHHFAWVDGANVRNVRATGMPGVARVQILGGTGGMPFYAPNGGAIPGAYVAPDLVY